MIKYQYSTLVEKQIDRGAFEMIEKLRDTDIKVLIYLYKNGPCPIVYIVKGCNMSFATAYRSIHALKELKLITEKPAKGNVRIIALSKWGNIVVEKLLEIDAILHQAQEST